MISEVDANGVVYVDNGQIVGWYFQKEGQYYGDGTRKVANETAKRMSDNNKEK